MAIDERVAKAIMERNDRFCELLFERDHELAALKEKLKEKESTAERERAEQQRALEHNVEVERAREGAWTSHFFDVELAARPHETFNAPAVRERIQAEMAKPGRWPPGVSPSDFAFDHAPADDPPPPVDPKNTALHRIARERGIKV